MIKIKNGVIKSCCFIAQKSNKIAQNRNFFSNYFVSCSSKADYELLKNAIKTQ